MAGVNRVAFSQFIEIARTCGDKSTQIVNFDNQGRFKSGGQYSSVNLLGRRFRSDDNRAKNNEARTQLLCALGDTLGINYEVDGGKAKFSEEFLRKLADKLGGGKDVLALKDFKIKDGVVTSGSPLTGRRIFAIVNRVASHKKSGVTAEFDKPTPVGKSSDTQRFGVDKVRLTSLYAAKLGAYDKALEICGIEMDDLSPEDRERFCKCVDDITIFCASNAFIQNLQHRRKSAALTLNSFCKSHTPGEDRFHAADLLLEKCLKAREELAVRDFVSPARRNMFLKFSEKCFGPKAPWEITMVLAPKFDSLADSLQEKGIGLQECRPSDVYRYLTGRPAVGDFDSAKAEDRNKDFIEGILWLADKEADWGSFQCDMFMGSGDPNVLRLNQMLMCMGLTGISFDVLRELNFGRYGSVSAEKLPRVRLPAPEIGGEELQREMLKNIQRTGIRVDFGKRRRLNLSLTEIEKAGSAAEGKFLSYFKEFTKSMTPAQKSALGFGITGSGATLFEGLFGFPAYRTARSAVTIDEDGSVNLRISIPEFSGHDQAPAVSYTFNIQKDGSSKLVDLKIG